MWTDINYNYTPSLSPLNIYIECVVCLRQYTQRKMWKDIIIFSVTCDCHPPFDIYVVCNIVDNSEECGEGIAVQED
jgi:hypothetical protein